MEQREKDYKQYEENVSYLRRNIPPDDIYLFAEQALMSASFFLKKWNEWVDIQEVMKNDPVAKAYIISVMGLLMFRDEGIDVPICNDLIHTDDL